MDEIKRLEMIARRLERRATKKKSAFITPIPISNGVAGECVEGVILRYMFPCDGKITKAAILFDKKPKQSVVVEFDLMGLQSGVSSSVVVDKKKYSFEPDINVSAFDCLTVRLSYDVDEKVPENNVKEVWTAFLWTPSIADVEVKSFLIKEMEKDAEDIKDKAMKEM